MLTTNLSAHAFAADAGDQQAVESALQAVHAQLGGPDVLVYNAAVPRMENVLTTRHEDLIFDFQANVAGALHAGIERKGHDCICLHRLEPDRVPKKVQGLRS